MIVFFTDSYHRTGSRSFSKTCIHEVYNAEVLVPRFLLFLVLAVETEFDVICVRVHWEQAMNMRTKPWHWDTFWLLIFFMIKIFWQEVEECVPPKGRSDFEQANLSIGIHLDQILPEERDWIVNTSAQTFHLQQGVVLIQQFYINRHLGQKPTLTNSFHSSSLTSPLTALGQKLKFRPLESMPTLEELRLVAKC